MYEPWFIYNFTFYIRITLTSADFSTLAFTCFRPANKQSYDLERKSK